MDVIIRDAVERSRALRRIEQVVDVPVAAPSAPTPKVSPHSPKDTIEQNMLIQGEMARAKGYTGDSCTRCQNFTMLRNGTCLKCDTCGETTGCS